MDITTERLHIRDIEETDLDALFELQTDPHVLRFVGWPRAESKGDTRAWIANTTAHNNARPRFSHNCTIVLRGSGNPAGWVGFGHPSAGKGYGDLDFGYAILPAHWGNGYMTEALTGTLAFIFEQLDVVVIQDGPSLPGVSRRLRPAASVFGECSVANPASARVMEKAGMSRVAEFVDPKERSAENQRKFRYLIDREQWLTQSQGATPAART